MPKIIGFLGIHPEDICLYTAFALQNTGKSVGVIDNSKECILFQAVPTPDISLETVTCRNADFMRNIPQDKWHKLTYDYLLVLQGTAIKEPVISGCEQLVLVVDCEKVHLRYYRWKMQKMQKTMLVVLRDVCPDSISGKKLKEYFECENCFIEKWFTLHISEEDFSYRIRMQYEPLQKFAHISPGMELVILQLLRTILQKDAGGVGKAVKAAKKGKVLYH